MQSQVGRRLPRPVRHERDVERRRAWSGMGGGGVRGPSESGHYSLWCNLHTYAAWVRHGWWSQ